MFRLAPLHTPCQVITVTTGDTGGIRGGLKPPSNGCRFILYFGWSLSNTMGTDLCLEALENALASTGSVPGIFNTDQGCQFTSAEWVGRLSGLGVKISMDGRGRWMDNVFIERLWRSVKYERIYLFEHGTLPELRVSLAEWFDRYNHWRPHQNLGNLTPGVVYQTTPREPQEASEAATQEAA